MTVHVRENIRTRQLTVSCSWVEPCDWTASVMTYGFAELRSAQHNREHAASINAARWKVGDQVVVGDGRAGTWTIVGFFGSNGRIADLARDGFEGKHSAYRTQLRPAPQNAGADL